MLREKTLKNKKFHEKDDSSRDEEVQLLLLERTFFATSRRETQTHHRAAMRICELRTESRVARRQASRSSFSRLDSSFREHSQSVLSSQYSHEHKREVSYEMKN